MIIKDKLISLLKKIMYPHTYSSEAYKNYLVSRHAQIGNNVIIGSGSVVTKNIPNNSVFAGNPAKYICAIDDLYEKRKNLFLDNALRERDSIKKNLSRNPSEEEMKWFAVLWTSEKNKQNLIKRLKFSTTD